MRSRSDHRSAGTSVRACEPTRTSARTSSLARAQSVAAAATALEVLIEEPEIVERLNANAKRLRDGLRAAGFDIGATETPIVPVIIGDRDRTVFAWNMFYQAGLYTNCVLSPGVPPGMDLLRTSYMATHTDEQIDRVLEVFYTVGKELELI